MNKRELILIVLIAFSVILSGCIEKHQTNKPPHAEISAHEDCWGYPPLNVSFSLSAYDEDGYIVSWKFDANGDGIADYNGNGKPPSTLSYTYNNAGTYVRYIYDSSRLQQTYG